MRPSCFEVFLSFAVIVPAVLAVMMLRLGGWRPGSPLWEPMLLCVGATGAVMMLEAFVGLWWAWMRSRC